MPKTGMEPIRREALVEATICEIGETGTLNVTVGQIASRAGVSPALAFHYFGDKEQIFLAAMRSILSQYGAEIGSALSSATSPRDRLDAIIVASFSRSNFRHDVVSAWLNFYVLAQTSPEASRLLTIYQRRLHSNLVHALKPLAGGQSPAIAMRIAGLIDGLYLRFALKPDNSIAHSAADLVRSALDSELQATTRGATA